MLIESAFVSGVLVCRCWVCVGVGGVGCVGGRGVLLVCGVVVVIENCFGGLTNALDFVESLRNLKMTCRCLLDFKFAGLDHAAVALKVCPHLTNPPYGKERFAAS